MICASRIKTFARFNCPGDLAKACRTPASKLVNERGNLDWMFFTITVRTIKTASRETLGNLKELLQFKAGR
jgi:hypothetical protein